MTSRCLGNGRSDASYKQYGGVSAWYKQFSVSASYKQYVSDECTYNIQSRQKHNMLSFLHAACLKLLVFFTQYLISHTVSTYCEHCYILRLKKLRKQTIFNINTHFTSGPHMMSFKLLLPLYHKES